MFEIWFYSLISVFIVSLISLVGVLVLALNKNFLPKLLYCLVSLAAGGMLGDVFIHLLPEIFKDSDFDKKLSLFIFLGILIFFVLEKFIRWRHCHECYPEENPSHKHIQPFGYVNLIGDGLHNFINGIMIAGSYLASPAIGIATTFAVVFHEIPQEIGDFGVLLKAGFSRLKAIFFNLLSALAAVIGALLILIINVQADVVSFFIIPLTAGGFIYIALADLVLELHRETGAKKSLWQLLFFILGIGVMYLLLLIE